MATVASMRPPVERRAAEKCWVPGALLLGVLVGLLLPVQPRDSSGGGFSPGYLRLSEVLGWTYFCAWSASFYPQIVLNCVRRSVVGLSLEYQLLNLTGFAFYFLFNAVLFWDPHVQEEYKRVHSGHSSAVRLDDVLFAGHAALATATTLLQACAYYDHPPLEGSDRCLRAATVGALTFLVLAALALAIVIWAESEKGLDWLAYLSLLSGTKVAISVFKYCPQVWMNFKRKSTEGWNIYNVLLDFSGGLLSLFQLLLDAWAANDWSAVTGDPAKFMLGFVSLVFDIIFMLQHYCFYRKAARHPVQQLSEAGITTNAFLVADVPTRASLSGREFPDAH